MVTHPAWAACFYVWARAVDASQMEASHYCAWNAVEGSTARRRARRPTVETIVQDDRGHFWARTTGSAWKRGPQRKQETSLRAEARLLPP